ncbi:MAG: class B sortase [Eubacteriales bacterium]|nr:class B sortase [Eubacteriales bacterium]
MSKNGKKKNKFVDFLLTVILLASIGVFCYAGYNLYHIYTEYKKGTDEYNRIEQMAVKERDPDEIKKQEEAGQIKNEVHAPISVDFKPLTDINKDVVGWIYMEALPDINYPVVHGKDNDEYLHATYEHNYNFAGTIFFDYENSGDLTDLNTIVYGHNMKNGSMFGSLKKYVREQEVYKKSKYFWILTPDRNFRYEIFSAYTTAVDSDTYTLFKGPGKEFDEWLPKMMKNSEIKTDASILTMQDRIVTLSTCTGDYSTRFVVQGRLSGIEELTNETFAQLISRKEEEKRKQEELERQQKEAEAAWIGDTTEAEDSWTDSEDYE